MIDLNISIQDETIELNHKSRTGCWGGGGYWDLIKDGSFAWYPKWIIILILMHENMQIYHQTEMKKLDLN